MQLKPPSALNIGFYGLFKHTAFELFQGFHYGVFLAVKYLPYKNVKPFMAEKRGQYIGFMDYFKTAFPLMLMSILISTFYLLFWYVCRTETAMAVTIRVGVILALFVKMLNSRQAKKRKKECSGI